MLNDIKERLAENYRNDEDVLSSLIDEATTIALSISNRSKKDIDVLKPYIVECVVGDYLSRGGEGLNSLSEGGVSSSLKDNRAIMRDKIIRDGLRRCY
jgi:hypothetical protein